MDRVLNPKDEKHVIYEIYRACRLCGAGAGYKMPIIQNVIDLQGDGVELKQKIKECVQIEVNHTDRMPPLICELCVDKVNDFHEFLVMCRQTNRRTRLCLGLPLHSRERGEESVNSIRGATELDRTNSDGEQSGKTRTRNTRNSKETVNVKTKIEGERTSNPVPAPKRTTRLHADTLQTEEPTPPVEKSKLKRPRENDIKTDTPPPARKVKIAPEPAQPSKPGHKSTKNAQRPIEPKEHALAKNTPKQTPKPALKKDLNSLSLPKSTPLKTPASRAPVSKIPSSEIPLSKAPASRTLAFKTRASETPSPKTSASKAALPKPASPEKSKGILCRICQVTLKNRQGFSRHNAKHQPTFTSPKHACNACELWFEKEEQARAHHLAHNADALPYKCTRCYGYFKLHQQYLDHFAENLCLSVYEVPDVKCWECWQTFPTNKLMDDHHCLGEDARPGGKCSKCNRNYSLLKYLLKHESGCTYKKKGEVSVEPEVQASLLTMQVRIARCDPLLRRGGHVDVAHLPHSYGLDSKCRYPYLPARIKSEPPTTNINHVHSNHDTDKEGFIIESYAHWDTNDSKNSDSGTKVDSLSAMSLNTINAKKCVGAYKKGKVKEDEFDEDLDMSKRIDSILDNLANEDGLTSCSYDSDSILDKNNAVQGSEETKPSVAEDNQTNNDSQNSCDSESVLNETSVNDDGKVEDKVITNAASDKIDVSPDKMDAVCDKLVETSEKIDVTFENMDVAPVELDVTSDKIDVTSEKLDVTSDKLDVTPDKIQITSGKLDSGKSEIVEDTSSISSENEDNNSIRNERAESMKERDNEPQLVAENDEASHEDIHDDLEERRNVGTSNSNSEEGNEQNKIEISNDTSQKLGIDLSKTKNNSLTNEGVQKNDNVDSNNQSVQVSLTEDIVASSVREQDEDKLGNSNLVSHNINFVKHDKMNFEANNHEDDKASKNKGNKYLDETFTQLEKDNFSKIDEITNKILKENETFQEYSSNDSDDKHNDDIKDESHQKSDPRSDPVSPNSVKSFETNGFDVRDRFNIDDLSDEDKRLMADIDAQIGEDDQKTGENYPGNYGNDQKISEIHKTAENDQRFKENEQTLGENDESLSKNNHKFGENDKSFSKNKQILGENDESFSKSEHKFAENVESFQENGQILIENVESPIKNDHKFAEDIPSAKGHHQKTKAHYDILKNQNDLKSLDLDTISDDEFNFDA